LQLAQNKQCISSRHLPPARVGPAPPQSVSVNGVSAFDTSINVVKKSMGKREKIHKNKTLIENKERSEKEEESMPGFCRSNIRYFWGFQFIKYQGP
jgi:hypothetical protein